MTRTDDGAARKASWRKRQKLPDSAYRELERIAADNSSEITDDLTVQLAIELGTSQAKVYRLRELLAAATAALKPFANYADPTGVFPRTVSITSGSVIAGDQLTMGDCYNAWAALAFIQKEKIKNEPPAPAEQPGQSTPQHIEEALRTAFPHFEDGGPITAVMIRAIGQEHREMITGWEPVKDRIDFADASGDTHTIIFDAGDDEVGEKSGWYLDGDGVVVELRPEDGSIQALQSRADGNGESCAQFCRAIEHALVYPVSRDAKKILMDALRMSWLLPDNHPDQLRRETSSVQPLATDEEVAEALYALCPAHDGGEYIDGHCVSPGGDLSWSAAKAFDNEFVGTPGFEEGRGYTGEARANAQALLEKFWIRRRGK